MSSSAVESARAESSPNAHERLSSLPGIARQEPNPKSEAILSPKEVAATKAYSSVEEILIDSKKYEKEAEILRSRPLWLDIVFGIAGAGVGFLSLLLYSYFNPKFSSQLLELIAALTLGIIVFAYRIASRQARIASLQAALEILEVRKRARTPVPLAIGAAAAVGQGTPSGEYFDQLVGINVKNLGDYYGLVRLHNDKSFRVSVGAGVVGFVLIAAAIGLALFRTGSETLPTAISAGSGVITEFIGAVFFLLYNRSVREMGAYFKSLLDVQNILLSLKLVNDTRDDKEKVKMVGMMISYLVGRQQSAGKTLLAGLSDDQPKPTRTKAEEPQASTVAAGQI